MSSRCTPLAIVGIGCLFPSADNVSQYWANIREGVDAITDIPPTHWDPRDYFSPEQKQPDMTYARRGGFLNMVQFDPLEYGISPNNIEATDTTQLLGMVVARQALLDAGYSTNRDNTDGRAFNRDRASVIMGVTGALELVIPLGARLGHPLWRRALADAGVDSATAENVVQSIADSYVPWQENSFPGLLGNVAAGRIANRFDLGGTNCVVDAACASSLSAIHMAAMELATERCDIAIAGGIDTFNDIFMYMCFSKTPALSPTGNARPFAENGDGTILGEGIGALILKRLPDAVSDGDNIYAVIKGIGTSSDGRGNAIYAPSVGGQVKALEDAYQQAGVSPATVELLEAHGTGTAVGDAVEAEALAAVYGKYSGTWCALGSVKSMIGHTKSAAGVAGLIKVVMALRYQVLPPTIKVEKPLPQLEPWKMPMYINTVKRPWLGRDEHPRRAAVSAFGFGGSNFHCVLEEYQTATADIDWDDCVLLFVFSADSKQQLTEQLNMLDVTSTWVELRGVAAHSRASFDSSKVHRLALVAEQGATSIAELVNGANQALAKQNTGFWQIPNGVSYASGNQQGEIALLFPGQGSQYTGMLSDLACQFPQFRTVLAEANRVGGESEHGKRLSDLIYPVPVFNDDARREQEEMLRDTRHAQPAIGAVSLAGLHILQHFGMQAKFALGHSYGELVALCAAGVYDAKTLHQLSYKRGHFMATREGDRGAMLAIFSARETVQNILLEDYSELVIANHNAPKQVVLSGSTKQIEKAANYFRSQQIDTALLPVSAAFHSHLVSDAEERLAEILETVEIARPNLTVLSNTTGDCYPKDATAIRKLLSRQLSSPVEFVKQVEKVYDMGARTFVEIGPGARLNSLVKAILGEKIAHIFALDASSGKRSGKCDLANLLGVLSVLGHKIDLSQWDIGYSDSVQAKTKSSNMTIPLCGANYTIPRQKNPVKPFVEEVTPVVANPTTATQTNMEKRVLDKQKPPVINKVPNLSEALHATEQGIVVLQSMQEQTANLHRQYLEGQEMAQQTIRQLLQQQQHLIGVAPAPAIESQPIVRPEVSPPITAHTATPSTEQHSLSDANSLTAEVADTSYSQAATTSIYPETSELKSLLLEVVSEKTGYPLEMLSLDMSLDTDLGIDSIKRVEILSVLQEKLPGSFTVKPEELGTFQCLQNIVEFIAEGMGTKQPSDEIVTPLAEKKATSLSAILLEVVSEKTGYPLEMLDMAMDMDSDLGIDSIKRVEILSVLQDRLPDMSAIKPEQFGDMRTLQDIAMAISQPSTIAKQSSPPQQAVDLEQRNLERQILITLDLASDRQTLELPEQSIIWVVAESSEDSEPICNALAARKLCAKWVTLDSVPEDHLAGLIIVVPTIPDNYYMQNVFLLVQRIAAVLGKTANKQDTILASVTRLGGNFGVNGLDDADPIAGGIAGLIKTASHEWKEVFCKAIDTTKELADMAERIVEECLTNGPLEVGLSADSTCTLSLQTEPLEVVSQKDILNAEDGVVISGGARGVTAEVAFALAKTYGTKLLLLGRSPYPEKEAEWLQGLDIEADIKQAILANSPKTIQPSEVQRAYQNILANREISHNLDRIRATGSKVLYRSVDIRDPSAVSIAVNEARQIFGTISGLVHGAGVLADRLIEDQTEQQFETVYTTKVQGIQSLLAATVPDKLKTVIMFSSSTARFGRRGQCSYAIANETLNKIAQRYATRNPECRTISINWGPWQGGMVTPALKTLFAGEGIEAIDLQVGARYLMQEINNPKNTTEITVLASRQTLEEKIPAVEEEIPAVNMRLAFDRVLNITGHAFLESHVMNGRSVLPVAIIIEWLAHGAMHDNPGFHYHGFNRLQIFKGLTLQADKNLNLQILVGQNKRNGNTEIVLTELRNGKTLHASAEIILSEEKPIPQKAIAIPSIEGQYSQPQDSVYRNGRLFHGNHFQGITAIHACSEQGIIAQSMAAPPPSKWMEKPIRTAWLTDPMATDASFQMMILWSFERLGVGSLPTAVGQYRQYRKAFPSEGTRIIINVLEYTAHRALANIQFIDSKNQLVAKMDACECVIDPSLQAAFAKNHLLPATT